MSENKHERDFKELIKRYVQGQSSESEKMKIEAWFLGELSHNDARPEINEKLEKALWGRIASESGMAPKRKPLVRKLLWPAASVAAMLIIGLFVFFNERQSKNTIQSSSQTESAAATINASSEENTLKLLPDSSLVILSKNSRLILSEGFNTDGLREVTLIGKAFFDIKHDPSKPFIIHSGKIRTEVLGTSFDISSSANSDQVVVNVIRGKVRVRNTERELAVLTKDMQIVYSEEKNESIVKRVDASRELAWKTEDLEFDNVSFKEAETLLEERFGVSITIPDRSLQETRFTTSLGADETLDHFLKIVCEFNNVDYIYNKNNQQITIKPLNP